MESNPSVSLSATQATPSPASTTEEVSPQSLKGSLTHSDRSSGSSLSIRAPLSTDSDDEIANKINGHKVGSGGSSISDSSSESEGFLSGEEEFETSSERPSVADPDDETLEMAMEGEDSSVPFVEPGLGFLNFLLPKALIPKAQVSGSDEDDVFVDEGLGSEVEEDGFSGVGDFGKPDSVVGSPKVRVLGGWEGEEDEVSLGRDSSVVEALEQKLTESNGGVREEKQIEVLGGDNVVSVETAITEDTDADSKYPIEVEEDGVSDIKEVELPVQKTTVLGNGTNQSSPVIEQFIDSNFVEADKDLNSTNQGDSFVEFKDPILSGLEAGVFGDVEENGVSGTNEMELPVDGPSDQATVVVGEPVDSKLVEADADVAKVEEHSAVNSGSLEKNLEPVSNPVFDMAEVEKEDDEKIGGGVDESVSLQPKNNREVPELQIEPQNDLGNKLYEPRLAANGVESESSDGTDEAQTVDSRTKSAELDSVEEAISLVLATEESKHLENGNVYVTAQGDGLDDAVSSQSHTPESAVPSSNLDPEIKQETEDELNSDPDYEEEDEGSVSDEDAEGLIFDGSKSVEQIMKELEQGSGVSSHSGAENSREYSQRIDGQIVTDSDEEVDTDEEGDGKEVFDPAALAALLKAATSAESDNGSISITSSDGSRLFSIERPAGLGSSMLSLKPPPRPNRANLFTRSELTVGAESENNLSEEEKKKLEKIQLLRVKLLRLVEKLHYTPEDSLPSQVLYRLVLAAGRHTSKAFSLETAKRTAMQLEAEGKDDLDISLNILVLGKTGVGKSATINSIFGEEKVLIDAFKPATTVVKEIIGTVAGVKLRVFDTPGLRSSVMEQGFNRRILSSVKKFTKKYPLDIVLYIDRLDTQTRDLNDMPLLKSITSTLGSSIWRNAVVTLTHAASAPPDGPSGSPLSYEVFVAQRSHVVQQAIGQAVGDLRLMNPSIMNPVALAENHHSCRKNRDGQSVLPNGHSWKPQLLLLCYSLKILSEVNSLSKPQDPFDHRKLFGFRVRSPPLAYLLSSLLQSRAHPKLLTDQGGENPDSDIELEDLLDSDQEEEDEYDQLPPFKPLRKSQIAKLSKEHRKAYFDEYDYRVKLLQKKQLREELKRMKEMKKKGKAGGNDNDYMGEDIDQENGSPATVPVPLPDMALPPSFDGDNPAHRYRFLEPEPTSQLLARPVLDTHGWDHDCGYDGVSIEQNLPIAGRFPAGVAVQITKDKKEFNIHLDSSAAAKLGENGSTLAGFDIQTIGKQLAYSLRGETKFKNFKKNKTAAGVSMTYLGGNVVTGLKVEDQIAIGKRLVLVGSSGTVRSQGDMAYGANLEARLMEKDFPIGQDQSTLGLSLMKWRGDLALGANLQSQFAVGRSSKIAVRVGLNNKLSGQITVRTSSSEQLQIALVGILPIALSIFRTFWPAAGESYSAY